MTIHEFKDSYKEGLKGEAFLDDFFGRAYPDFVISEVDRDQERRGIDRTFDNGQGVWNVEYKTDYMAQKTGNIYLEMTVNHWPRAKLGWAVGSQADTLIYYIPEVAVYSLSFALLHDKLEKGNYANELTWKTVWNKSFDGNSRYSSFGMLLPIKKFEKDLNPKIWRF